MYSPVNATILALFLLVFDIYFSGSSGRPQRCYPVDCVVSDWTLWSSCSSSMSEQQESESRSRSVTTPASCAGKACPLELEETRLCYGSNTQNSQGRPRRCHPEDCVVSAWSSWSSCSASMSDEQELKSRSRSITTPSCIGKDCRRKLKESRLCYESNTQNGQGNRKSTATGAITISVSISGGVLFIIICICCWKCGVC
ncbi:spondin-1-like isoform X2 [Acropora millepora]|uniref:spondin-1-like isoform X2 n=1 Tax=Acropora millepora TaxID=45264 RepID=UPI001CF2F425|nr:spondin-1-like isoform X2 [Acropora millepora]